MGQGAKRVRQTTVGIVGRDRTDDAGRGWGANRILRGAVHGIEQHHSAYCNLCVCVCVCVCEERETLSSTPHLRQRKLPCKHATLSRAGTRARSLPILLARSLSFAWARTLSVGRGQAAEERPHRSQVIVQRAPRACIRANDQPRTLDSPTSSCPSPPPHRYQAYLNPPHSPQTSVARERQDPRLLVPMA